MKKGESRFFLNWQMNKDVSLDLHHCSDDLQRSDLLLNWFSGILEINDETE
jgi:hypothetical protein